MNINLTKSTDAQLKVASKRLGFNENVLVQRAILFYLAALEDDLKLKQEFEGWDSASDESFARFEKSL